MISITRSEFVGITRSLCVALQITGEDRLAFETIAKEAESVAVGTFVGCPVDLAGLRNLEGPPLAQSRPELMQFAIAFDAYIDSRFAGEVMFEIGISDA